MTNFEFYKKEIKDILNKDNYPALVDGKMVSCSEVDCVKCDFNNGSSCSTTTIKWLFEEYEPKKPKINKRTKMFLDSLESGYVARDSDGDLCYFYEKPYKTDDDIWDDIGTWVDLSAFPFLSLDFITWEDEESWNVEDLRKLEVFEH